MTDEELHTAAEEINDGWYANTQIDWWDFLDRLEDHTGIDLGNDMLSPQIKAIQRHIKMYRKL